MLLVKYYAKFILSLPGKIFVLIGLLTLFFVCVTGCTKVDVEFKVTYLLPQGE